MSFKIKYSDGNSRVGILSVNDKQVETPFFMPVATKGAVKYVDSLRLREMGVDVVISNAFILSLRPGVEVVKKSDGIGSFMNHKGLNFSDSGGFQMYSDSLYLKSNSKGVWFKNPYTGERIFMTPEENMRIQKGIGSDVAMCFDRMPLYEDSKDEISRAVELTSDWAKRCKREHFKLLKKSPKEQLLFGITQGGKYKELREKSAKDLVEIGFDGYAIGGFGMGESFDEEMKIVKQQKRIFPVEKPIYLMGIGNPVEILEAVSMGVDIFDSRLPTQNARHGTLFTSEGSLKIMSKKFERDCRAIDSKCDCFVCKNYSRAYVRFLLREGEGVGFELASYHNLYFLLDLMHRIREAIKKGKFKEFKREFLKRYHR